MTNINPIDSSPSNIVDPSASTPAEFSTSSNNNSSDPWSFGGYFNEEETKKFQDSFEKTISNQIKKDQAKSHEASEQLKRVSEGGDLYE